MAAERQRAAALQSALVMSIRIGGAALQMLLVAVVALRFPVEMVGLNGVMWAVALVARAAGTFGLDTSGMRSQSPLWAEGRHDEARAIARRDARALLRIWAVLTVLALAASLIVQLTAGTGGLVLVLYGVAVSSALGRLFMVQRVARQAPLAGQFLESVALPGLALLIAIASALLAPQLLIPGQVAAFVIISIAFWRLSPSAGPPPPSVTVPPVPWGQSLILAAGSALTALSVRGLMFLLGARSLAATGTYEVAQRIQSAGAMGTTAVATVFMPRIAMSVTRRGRLVALVLEAAAVSAVLPTLLLGFLLVLGEQRIVDLLGPEYQGTWGASVILVVATLINALTSATSNVLMFGGRERLFMVISGAQLVLVVGGAWLVGTDTAVGMAWWMLIGELLRSCSMVTGFLVHLRGLRPRHRAD